MLGGVGGGFGIVLGGILMYVPFPPSSFLPSVPAARVSCLTSKSQITHRITTSCGPA